MGSELPKPLRLVRGRTPEYPYSIPAQNSDKNGQKLHASPQIRTKSRLGTENLRGQKTSKRPIFGQAYYRDIQGS